MLTIALIPPIIVEEASANTIDDTLYLRDSTNYYLSTQAPSGAADRWSVPVGQTATRRWVNVTQVPSGSNWNIDSGNYFFYFYMDRSGGRKDTVYADVTFNFGYVTQEGGSVVLVTGSLHQIDLTQQIEEYLITVSSVESKTIPSGSKLFMDVIITASGDESNYAYFYYDGRNQQTRIVTPKISNSVPEFPFGIVFIIPALLSAYFLLKRRFGRFN